MPDRPLDSRKTAMAMFDAIIKSSIKSRALLFRVRARSTTCPSFATGVASMVSNSSAPLRSRCALSRCAASD
jgi:hypothetical protein